MLPRTTTLLNDGITQGLHIGAQLYVSRHGRPVADFALGESRRGIPMTTATLMNWLSCSKPVAAVAVAQLVERGLLSFDQPLPTGVTLRQILTHTTTGQAAYAPRDTWRLLGELVANVTGQPFAEYVRQELLGADSWIGMPPEQYRTYGARMGILHNTFHSVPHPQPWDNETHAAAGCPGSGAYGPIRELGQFYEALLAGKFLRPATLTEITRPHRVGLVDHTFRRVMNWGLGFVVDSRQFPDDVPPYGFGRHGSPRAFGHGGMQAAMAFADPVHGLVVAWLCNGMCGEPRHTKRTHAINTAIYEDLGLAPPAAFPSTIPTSPVRNDARRRELLP
jgi:CubicO group peptidase (beta-lactamase class C family)